MMSYICLFYREDEGKRREREKVGEREREGEGRGYFIWFCVSLLFRGFD